MLDPGLSRTRPAPRVASPHVFLQPASFLGSNIFSYFIIFQRPTHTVVTFTSGMPPMQFSGHIRRDSFSLSYKCASCFDINVTYAVGQKSNTLLMYVLLFTGYRLLCIFNLSNEMGNLLTWSRVSTTVWLHCLDSNEALAWKKTR